MHGRATRTRAWCGHVHAHGKDTHVRVATNRAGILLAIMRLGQLITISPDLEIDNNRSWMTDYNASNVPILLQGVRD